MNSNYDTLMLLGIICKQLCDEDSASWNLRILAALVTVMRFLHLRRVTILLCHSVLGYFLACAEEISDVIFASS